MINNNIIESLRFRFTPCLLFFTFHLLLMGWSQHLIAQEDQEIELARKYAEHSFREKDYDFALENYLKLYETNKNDININFRIGVCYTETNKDRTGGIPYLEYIVSHNNFPAEALYYLGKSYFFNYQFTEAVEALYGYKLDGRDDDLLAMTERLIDMAYNAREQINQPKAVRFELLDTTINSLQNDFRPLISTDEQKMFFTSNRRYVDGLATYVNDIYYSEATKSGWEKAKMLEISTTDHDEIVGIAPTGDMIMVYSNGDYATHLIKMAERKGRNFNVLAPNMTPAALNSDAMEYGACINTEGTMIIFSSDRLGGFGGMDLYKIEKTDRRNWGDAENLGSQINTPFNENFPTLSFDGRKLHFSSNAHSSIGGMDLFYSTYNQADSSFQRPINHGFPISTPFDDISISFNADESVAYISTTRTEGLGKLDIYKMYIAKESVKATFVSCYVFVGTPENSVQHTNDLVKVFPTIYDKNGNLFSKYEVDDGGVTMTLYPGEYILDVRFDREEEGYRENLIIENNEEETFLERMIYLTEPR